MNSFRDCFARLPLIALTAFASSAIHAAPIAAQTADAAPPGSGAAASYTDLGYGQYPRVTEVEQQLLGKTYEKEPLTTRVTRLETKQFGKPSPQDDLADRLDRLDALIKHKPAADESYDTQAGPAAQAPGGGQEVALAGSNAASTGAADASSKQSGTQYSASDYGSYPRVTELEQQLLGSTYVKDPLPVRVARLEEKEFGKATPNDDLCDRIDKLDKIANPHKNSRVADNGSDGSAQDGSQNGRGNGSKSGGVGGGIGKSLLGLLGGAMGGGMFGGNGMMGNGLNMNQMMPGLQDNMRKDAAAERQQQQQQQQGGGGGQSARSAAAVSSPFAAGALPVIGPENRIAVIEKFVLGREHGELPLVERVEHVEKKLVPYEHHQAGQDLAIRVDHLWSILAAANRPSTKSVAASQGPTQ